VEDSGDLPADVPDAGGIDAFDSGVGDGFDAMPDELGEVVPEEIQFIDLMPDFTPPWVKSTVPADGEMGVPLPGPGQALEITITFTETVFEPTIGDKTIQVLDPSGKEMAFAWEFSDEKKSVVLLKAAGAVFPASPYSVELSADIRDLAGNEMGNSYSFTFYTAAPATSATYKELAGKFAPVLYQEVSPTLPQADYPTRFDADGNWMAADNVDWIKNKAESVEPYLHYSVTETKSHFFIFYMMFYPYRNTEDGGNAFGNDVSGTMVLVRKGDQAPVALETYFKQDDDERSFSFITQEAELLPAGASAFDYEFDGVYPQATLFPNGHYVAYVSARKHESCLWLLENTGLLDGCELNPGIKAGMQKIELVYKNDQVTPIQKTGGTFPTSGTDYGFGLLHVLDTWWPHRGDIGDAKMWAETYDYVPFTSTIFQNRPTLKEPLASAFVDPIGNDNGRPPWAWKYNPQNGTSFYNMQRGVMALDPAVHFKQRHDQGNNWANWNGASGWSLDYCYNSYFNLDFRSVWPECSAKQ